MVDQSQFPSQIFRIDPQFKRRHFQFLNTSESLPRFPRQREGISIRLCILQTALESVPTHISQVHTKALAQEQPIISTGNTSDHHNPRSSMQHGNSQATHVL
ncbi:Protein of unknown function [Pyronema omphalodes CBS 100304]|uniref:Uncharacterized protein n=1 Tax=Pyronema omphalodes (strain CBS 100304) TaxID=1076935 RepID=U4LDH8_PYROM|nr:Protein of unknown function [Pyronema omphalodes CBS 100304]